MKLAVIGGGGVRAPFLARTLIAHARECDISEIVFMDIDAEKLKIFGNLSAHIAKKIDSKIKFRTTMNAREAVKDANYVITTIREGGDEGRTKDEQIAQKFNVFGQETTGVGGFSFSLRSIPILIEYMDMVKEIANKNCIVFNFTNPAGLVTECLKKLGYENVYGICDGPMEFQSQVADLCGVRSKFSCTWYGLNHLSYMRDAMYDGKSVQKDLVNNDVVYKETEMKIMSKGLVEALNYEFPNEYLYFFYYNNTVMDSLRKVNSTRGQAVMEINKRMLTEMKKVDSKDFEKQFKIFHKHLMERENSYFTLESGKERVYERQVLTLSEFLEEKDEGGYAGVALNFIKGFTGKSEVTMTLLVQNKGTIDFLKDEDVIEISCDISKGQITKHHVGDVDLPQKQMIKQVKTFEDLATKAIINKDVQEGIRALMVHPLINTYDLAEKLMKEIMAVYSKYTDGWS